MNHEESTQGQEGELSLEEQLQACQQRIEQLERDQQTLLSRRLALEPGEIAMQAITIITGTRKVTKQLSLLAENAPDETKVSIEKAVEQAQQLRKALIEQI
jgi:hypothetical protein